MATKLKDGTVLNHRMLCTRCGRGPSSVRDGSLWDTGRGLLCERCADEWTVLRRIWMETAMEWAGHMVVRTTRTPLRRADRY